MERSESQRYPEIVSLDYDSAQEIRHMSKVVYPEYIKPWENDDILDPHYIPLGILDLSFLLREADGNYSGYCVGMLLESQAEPEEKEAALYIVDLAVLPGSQRTYRGLMLCKEVLRRMEMYDIDRLEFHAREATSYQALMNSSHTVPLLAQYGYKLTEYTDLRPMLFYDDNGTVLERGRLIALTKLINTSHV